MRSAVWACVWSGLGGFAGAFGAGVVGPSSALALRPGGVADAAVPLLATPVLPALSACGFALLSDAFGETGIPSAVGGTALVPEALLPPGKVTPLHAASATAVITGMASRAIRRRIVVGRRFIMFLPFIRRRHPVGRTDG